MNWYDLYIENIKYHFEFLSNWDMQQQEWILKPSSLSLSYDAVYYDFMDILGGRDIIEKQWDFLEEKLIFSNNLKDKLYHFSLCYNAYFENENYPFHSNEQYYSSILNDQKWKDIIVLAGEVKLLLETDMQKRAE